MFKKLRQGLFKSRRPPPRRMEDDAPGYVPPNFDPSMTAEEREQMLLREWLANLDPDLRPFQLFEQYPKIARELVRIWGQPPQCNRYMNELLIAKREGRQGFPPPVAQELLALSAYYKEKYATLIGMRGV